MGMAASQARLLCITARIHDVEQQAQSIQFAKQRLALESDRVYEEYNEALDAQTMVLSSIDMNGTKSTVAATFNNLCSRDRLNPASHGTTYALRDARGRLIVEDEIAQKYNEYKNSGSGQTAEGFALYMLYGKEEIGNLEEGEFNQTLKNAETNAWVSLTTEEPTRATERLQNLHEQLTTLVDDDDIYNTSNIANDSEKMEEYNELMTRYREELYSRHGLEVINKLMDEAFEEHIDTEEYDKLQPQFEYFVNIYNQIEANGGACIGIGQFDGFNGDAANDSDWLTTMVQCGQITIEMVEEDEKGKPRFKGTSPSSDTSLKYVDTASVDNKALKKAELKYEHDLKEIEKKDKKFDMTLTKLETERQALTTEYDNVKKVVEDNIDRTFKIFS
jgi:hypothetical protein